MPATTCRSFLGVLYPDATNYNCDEVLERLKALFPQFAYIVHDMDVDDNGELKKPHIHWVGQRSACTLDFVASHIEIPENTIEYCRKFKRSIRYLIHKDSPSKFQYEQEKIFSSFDLTKYFDDDYLNNMLDEIVDFIYSDECVNFASLYRFCSQKGIQSVLTRNFAVINTLFRERMFEK